MFSAPHTQVLLRAQNVTAGLAVEVEDRGLGMSLDDQHRVNNLLADPERTDIGELLRDGRIGLFVVSAIARRHGITVRVQTNIYGGIQAVVVLPHGLLGAPPQDREPHQQTQAQQTGQTARPIPVPALVARASAAIPASPHPARLRAEVPIPTAACSNDSAAGTHPGVGESPHGPVVSVPPVPTGDPAGHGTADPGMRPQLPQRRGQTHLAPELHQVPAPRKENPAVDHDPDLMAAFMRGVTLSETGADDEDSLWGRTDGIH
jgi:hypothetical protein